MQTGRRAAAHGSHHHEHRGDQAERLQPSQRGLLTLPRPAQRGKRGSRRNFPGSGERGGVLAHYATVWRGAWREGQPRGRISRTLADPPCGGDLRLRFVAPDSNLAPNTAAALAAQPGRDSEGGDVTTLFGRNPVVTAVAVAALLAIGLVVHALLLPWVGGALIVAGIVRFASGRGGGVSGSNRGRLR